VVGGHGYFGGLCRCVGGQCWLGETTDEKTGSLDAVSFGVGEIAPLPPTGVKITYQDASE